MRRRRIDTGTVSTCGVQVAAPRVGVDASGRAVVVWNTTNRGGVRTVSLP